MIAHNWQNIEGWFDFADYYSEILSKTTVDNAIFIEIGAWKGKSSSFMAVEILNSGKKIEFFVVDHFKGSIDEIETAHKEAQSRSIKDQFMDNIQFCRDGITKIFDMESTFAARFFIDEMFDFVFIDAGHDYESVKNDLESWYPKVKKGGIIAGHDIHAPGVAKAVNEFFNANYNRKSVNVWESVKY